MGEKELDLRAYRDGKFVESIYAVCTCLRMPLMIISVLTLIIFFCNNIIAFYICAPIMLLGEYGQLWGASYILKNRHLTVSGPYAHVRNPMYIGRFIIGLGLTCMTCNLYIIGTYTVLYCIYAHLRAGKEERILEGLFGARYLPYKKHVRRWIPKKKRYSRTEARTPSWMWVKKNHEDLNLYGIICVLVFIYFKITKYPNISNELIPFIQQEMAKYGAFCSRLHTKI